MAAEGTFSDYWNSRIARKDKDWYDFWSAPSLGADWRHYAGLGASAGLGIPYADFAFNFPWGRAASITGRNLRDFLGIGKDNKFGVMDDKREGWTDPAYSGYWGPYRGGGANDIKGIYPPGFGTGEWLKNASSQGFYGNNLPTDYYKVGSSGQGQFVGSVPADASGMYYNTQRPMTPGMAGFLGGAPTWGTTPFGYSDAGGDWGLDDFLAARMARRGGGGGNAAWRGYMQLV